MGSKPVVFRSEISERVGAVRVLTALELFRIFRFGLRTVLRIHKMKQEREYMLVIEITIISNSKGG